MFGKLTLRNQVVGWVDRAIDVQDSTLRAHLGAADAAPDLRAAASALENQYLATVSGAGAAVGGAASIPGIGTGLAVGLSVAETVGFLDATALFALAAAELRGHRVRDLPRRRALLLLVLLGDDAVKLVPTATDGEADGWGRRLVDLDDTAVDEISRTAEKWLLTRFGPRQGMVIVARLAPFGIGAAVGAAGNALTAKGVISRVRSAFAGGPAVVEPVAAPMLEPAVVEPAVVEPVVVEPVVVESVAVEAVAVEPPTGKYAGLHTFLSSLTGDEITLTIAELEAAVPGGLPLAARRQPGWWGNGVTSRAPQSRAWLATGLQVIEVELAGEKVRLGRAG